MPQLPQLFSSVARRLHFPPQQALSGLHMRPQRPQWLGFTAKLAQERPQQLSDGLHDPDGKLHGYGFEVRRARPRTFVTISSLPILIPFESVVGSIPLNVAAPSLESSSSPRNSPRSPTTCFSATIRTVTFDCEIESLGLKVFGAASVLYVSLSSAKTPLICELLREIGAWDLIRVYPSGTRPDTGVGRHKPTRVLPINTNTTTRKLRAHLHASMTAITNSAFKVTIPSPRKLIDRLSLFFPSKSSTRTL